MAPYLAILLAVLVLFILVGRARPTRVGDGSEYYAMFQAWQLTHRPWMTKAAFDGYDAMVHANQVIGMVNRQLLENAFPALRVGATADFNHFWFYSLLAFIVAKVIGVFGIALTAHQAFIGLHVLALGVTLSIGYRYFHWKGVLAVLVMVLGSPVFWFIDKVHTEFFTVCVVLSGIILMRSHRYVAAALCMALASTQNPSFALVACIPLFYRVVLRRKLPYRVIEVVMAVAVVVAVLAHPAYYFSRYHVVTPQLLAGGASMGANLSTFYIWIIDPDLGLLPNWPIGLAVVLVAFGMWVARNPVHGTAEYGPAATAGARWTTFALLYLAINLYAHASTQNLNSGATPGLARYALWYLPLGFPLFMMVFKLFPPKTKRRYAGLALLAGASVMSMLVNRPSKLESYEHASLSSTFIQKYLPGLYNPPAEIFEERFSGLGEGVHARLLRAVFGPDCAKMLVTPGPGRRDAVAPAGCGYDPVKLNQLINEGPIGKAALTSTHDAYYLRLDPADAAKLARVVPMGRHDVGVGGDGGTLLGDGWSGQDQWGLWSEQPVATLVLPCTPTEQSTLTLYLRPFRKQAITVSSGGRELWHGSIAGDDQAVPLQLGLEGCIDRRRIIKIDIPDAVSPLKLGLSTDGRMLGVGLSHWELKPR